MHKVFISYHHANEQKYKEYMSQVWGGIHFIDGSVDTGDIDENLSPQTIRAKIRDEYLRDTSVTIVLVGRCTKHRKHVDWEIGSSMVDGPINKKSGIVIIEVPSISSGLYSGITSQEIKNEISRVKNVEWVSGTTSNKQRHPHLPEKLMDNVDRDDVNIPILQWDDIVKNPAILEKAIDTAYQNRRSNNYYISEFRKHDNNSCY